MDESDDLEARIRAQVAARRGQGHRRSAGRQDKKGPFAEPAELPVVAEPAPAQRPEPPPAAPAPPPPAAPAPPPPTPRPAAVPPSAPRAPEAPKPKPEPPRHQQPKVEPPKPKVASRWAISKPSPVKRPEPEERELPDWSAPRPMTPPAPAPAKPVAPTPPAAAARQAPPPAPAEPVAPEVRVAPEAAPPPEAPKPRPWNPNAPIAREPAPPTGTTRVPGPEAQPAVQAPEPAKADDKAEKAEKAEKKKRRLVRGSALDRVIRTAALLGFVGAIALLLRLYFVQPFWIPSASMEPTLHGCEGCTADRVLVDKFTYRFRDIRRGDVIVFHRPPTAPTAEKVLIKRVIGMPGETVSARDGKVFIGRQVLDEPYIAESCRGKTQNFGPVTVPEGFYYVLGDNRCPGMSQDSRSFGSVPEDWVVGRAFLIYWPAGRIHFI